MNGIKTSMARNSLEQGHAEPFGKQQKATDGFIVCSEKNFEVRVPRSIRSTDISGQPSALWLCEQHEVPKYMLQKNTSVQQADGN